VEQIAISQQSDRPRTYKTSTIAMAIGVTLVAVLVVLGHWSSFGVVKKVMAVCFVLTIAIGPVDLTRVFGNRIREQESPDSIAKSAYLAILFGVLFYSL